MSKNIVFLLLYFISSLSYADREMSSAVENIAERFPKIQNTLEGCIDKVGSTEAELGCVQAFKYMYSICQVMNEQKFYKRYKSIPISYFNRACRLSGKAEMKVPSFVEMDEKSCVRGYETVRDRLITFQENKDVLEELLHGKFSYVYEKSTCKNYRRYVNLCAYLDGELKALLPNDFQLLPNPEVGKFNSEVCTPSDSKSEFIYGIDRYLVENANKSINQRFEAFIKNYRSRAPASTIENVNQCGELRKDYVNLDCVKFEKYADGEPIWHPDDINKEMQNMDAVKKMKINENDRINNYNLNKNKKNGLQN